MLVVYENASLGSKLSFKHFSNSSPCPVSRVRPIGIRDNAVNTFRGDFQSDTHFNMNDMC